MEKLVGYTKGFRFILQLFTEPVKFQVGNSKEIRIIFIKKISFTVSSI